MIQEKPPNVQPDEFVYDEASKETPPIPPVLYFALLSGGA